MTALDTSAVSLPGNGRTVATLSQYLAHNALYNLLDFAPLGVTINDGVGDAGATIKSVANGAAPAASGAHNSRAGVRIPAGIYKVTTSAVFTPDAATSLIGVNWFGDGWYTSIIRYGALGGATWLYDNGATARQQFNTFSDLGFEGADPAAVAGETDIPSNAKGFKITSASWEQAFKFFRCRFGYFDVDFDMEGTNTASEMKFFSCKIHHTRSTVYKLNNGQSFNHEFYGCDVEVIYGDIFDVSGGSGGGAIKVYGGSWIMLSKASAADTYFFKATSSIGIGAYPYIFSGVRFEFRGNHTNLVSLADTQTFDLAFSDCMFHCQNTVDNPNWAVIAGYSTLTYMRCYFYEYGGGQIKHVVNAAARRGQSGTIVFDSCCLPVDWSDRCSITSFFGHIRAINCHGGNIAAPVGHPNHWAHDFDLHWDAATPGQYDVWFGAGSDGTRKDNGSPTDNAWRLKVAQIKLGNELWPNNANEHTLKLPRNAIIKAIHLRKPASGTDATVTTINVGRDDKSGTAHLVSNSDQFKNKHAGDVDNYFYHVGTTANERQLRLYASAAPNQIIVGGICIVEYY